MIVRRASERSPRGREASKGEGEGLRSGGRRRKKKKRRKPAAERSALRLRRQQQRLPRGPVFLITPDPGGAEEELGAFE